MQYQLKLSPEIRMSLAHAETPVGMDIEYADEVTLLKSIEGRRDLG